MGKVYFLFFILLAKNLFSQRKDFYILGKDTVSKVQFLDVQKSKLKRFYAVSTVKESNIQTNRLIKRHKEGVLSFQEYFFLKKTLEKIQNKKVNINKTWVIFYFHGNDEKLKKKREVKKIQKRINKNEDESGLNSSEDLQLFRVCDSGSYIVKHQALLEENKWLIDSKSIFKKLFFPYKFDFGSFLIIKPNRQFAVYYGEYPFLFVIKKLEYWGDFEEYLKRGFYYNGKWVSLVKN